jgi:class 3 adenylate cyclase
MKYTGDGALMIWLLQKKFKERQAFCTSVVDTMRKLQQHLSKVIPGWAIEWQVKNLPERARFGITTGLVYALRGRSSTFLPGPVEDYAGYCINLAVRLQNHCSEISFLIHEPVLPRIQGLIKLIATA